jgi:hypothetical protein
LKAGLILASIDPLHRRVQVNKLFSTGAVAQLGERRVRNAKVGSSILLRSTKFLATPTEICTGNDNFAAPASLCFQMGAASICLLLKYLEASVKTVCPKNVGS